MLQVHSFSLTTDLASSTNTVASLALIKRPHPLDPNIPLQSQVHLMNLPGTITLGTGAQGSISPFEILHSVVHLALGPYFDAYTKGQVPQITGRGHKFVDTEAKTGMVLVYTKAQRSGRQHVVTCWARDQG